MNDDELKAQLDRIERMVSGMCTANAIWSLKITFILLMVLIMFSKSCKG
jgi:hypothetical protein